MSILRKEGPWMELRLWRTLVILILLVSGTLLITLMIYLTERSMRNDLLGRAKLVASSIKFDQLKNLSGSVTDLNSDDYLLLKQQFANAKEACTNCRFIYLMGRRSDGQVFFFADNEPQGSADESPAGQLYEEISPEYLKVFEGSQSKTVGPISDRWGEWISALVPMATPEQTGNEPIAVLGMDIDSQVWYLDIAKKIALPLGIIILAGLFGFTLALLKTCRNLRSRHAEIADNELFLQTLTEGLPDYIFVLDNRGQIQMANKVHPDHLKQDVIHRKVTDFIPARYQEVFEHHLSESNASKAPQTMEVIAELPDGEHHFLTRLTPTTLPGLESAIVMVATDITERKLAESERDELISEITERMKELRCLYRVNQALSSKQSIEDILSKVTRLVPPAFLYPENCYCQILFDGVRYQNQPFEESRSKLSADIIVKSELKGMIEIYYLEEYPKQDEGPFSHEERSLVDNIAKNLSEMIEHQVAEELLQSKTQALLESQSKLMQSEKLACIGVLAAGIAHEINNPLSFVKSNLSTVNNYHQRLLNLIEFCYQHQNESKLTSLLKHKLREMELEDLPFILEDITPLTEETLKGVERIQEIINGLRCFSRADQQQSEQFSLNQLIESSIQMVWNEIKYHCQLHKELGPLPLLSGNPGRISQVLVNLLINASQAIEESGTIWIRSRAEEERIILEIEDSGHGMSEEIQKQLFTPFFTTKPAGKGTGLGLSISHGIIEEHGGNIDVKSTLGVGTTFTITFPLLKQDSNSERLS
ncbi:PAS domain-containing sensor histidine kinase [Dongshaea marina]|uniref:PAS domain-containing sensor histidine kinase n=1 Tax=Dongshaea marina TaxID=2047966 RepID=UPI00131EF0B5|nr:ATP-binding protein [Dongshaea marina]